MIVFIDFDGVLHPEPCDVDDYFALVPLFEGVVRDFPGTRVVVSSAWRHDDDLQKLRGYFPPSIAAMIEGITPDHQNFSADVFPKLKSWTRHREVASWLAQHAKPDEDWIAVDDNATLFRPNLKNLMLCQKKWGMTETDAIRLRHKLTHGSRCEPAPRTRLQFQVN